MDVASLIAQSRLGRMLAARQAGLSKQGELSCITDPTLRESGEERAQEAWVEQQVAAERAFDMALLEGDRVFAVACGHIDPAHSEIAPSFTVISAAGGDSWLSAIEQMDLKCGTDIYSDGNRAVCVAHGGFYLDAEGTFGECMDVCIFQEVTDAGAAQELAEAYEGAESAPEAEALALAALSNRKVCGPSDVVRRMRAAVSPLWGRSVRAQIDEKRTQSQQLAADRQASGPEPGKGLGETAL